MGTAKIEALPSGSSNDITAKSGAALCYGDSGGPAFFGKLNSRKVVAVNSRGDISTTSYLVSVSTDAAKQFIQSWSQTNNQKICGVDSSAQGCRSSAPDLRSEFTLQSPSVTITGKMKPGREDKLDRVSFFLGNALFDIDPAQSP